MAAFIGNYYQHIMGILLADSNYETICKLYDLGDAVTVESLRKSIARKRGNLPKKITPKEFYTRVIWGLFENEDAIMCFARRLHVILEKDGIFPQEFKKEIDKISGWNSEAFDEGAFSSYLFYLLQKDKEAKKKDADSEPVKKKDVTELMDLAEDAEGCADFEGQPDSEQELPLAFSRRFFTKGARELLELGDAAFEQELDRLSVVFQHISTLEYSYEPLDFKGGENLIATLKEWVRHCLADSGNREILKVKGPLGSYKNRLMQYLYLAILRSLSCVTPIYIDIASYEKAAEGNEGIDENDFLKAFEEDIAAAEKIVAKSPNKKPLLMLDGVRDFTCRDESLYYSINERLQSMDWYLIVCMDTEFTVNKQNKYEIHPLVSNGFECYLRLRSMNLNRRQESIAFIRNCVDVFKVALPADVTAEQIYENLVRLNFLTLDAYWLTYILHSHLKGILERKNNISGLYTAICVSFLGSHKAMESASEFAYEFEFGKRNFKNANPYFDLRWRLIRKHRSVLDFLIAKFYIKKVSELNLVKGNKEQNVAALSFFNMVLQKSITRFVVAMLTGVDDYERQIMIVAKNHYDDLQLFGKSELTFW
ncbi:MAG: hypothetical protein IJN82_00735, partial [Clostridia bacterium]|nr:hypothetical protein [Clostridia bacterium]